MSEHDSIKVTDRRGAFRALGAVAAGVTAMSLLEAAPASAADGGSLLLGRTNDASSTTTLGSTSEPDQVLFVNDNTNHFPQESTNPGAVTGWSNSRTGVYGVTDSGDNGVIGKALSGSGNGVEGQAFGTGLDLAGTGNGRISVVFSETTGVPTYSGFNGEQVRDAAGDMYLWNDTEWLRVATVRPAYSGGSMHLLSSPVRLLDTRDKAARVSNTGAYASASDHALQVSGLTYLGQTVPAEAVGIVGNLTVVSPTKPGFATLYPTGKTRPTTSTLNYTVGQTVANGFTLTVGTGNTVQIYVSGATHVLLDVVAFIL